MTENQNNKEYKFQIIIIVLLSIIICFQLIHCIKLYEISYNSQLINMAMFNGDINSHFKKEYNILKTRDDIDKPHFGRRHMPIHPKPNDIGSGIEKEKVDINNNMYTLEMRVPMKFTKKDVNINFKDNIIAISFSGNMKLKNKNTEESNIFSVYKSFLVPDTKATLKDVKYDIKDGILIVNVPIIK